MKTILCFGDSNTFGTIPGGGRWEKYIRWPGKLQTLLGENYEVIEEGCGGRTTVWNDDLELYKNGRTALPIMLASHKPLDYVIISLGTNDLKTRFSLLPSDIAMGAAQLVKLVQTFPYGKHYPIPKVLLISPIELGEDIENSVFTGFNKDSFFKSLHLSDAFQKVAATLNCEYINAALYAHPSPVDCLHMDSKNHAALADAIFARLTELEAQNKL